MPWVPLFREHKMLLAWAELWALVGGLNLSWYFQGVGRLTLQAMIEMVTRAVSVALVYMTIRSSNQIGLLILINGGAPFACLAIGVYLIRKDTPLLAPCFKGGLQAIKDSWTFFIFRAAVNVCTVGNGIILGIFCPSSSVAYYSGAEKIVRGLISLAQPLSQVLYVNVNKKMIEGVNEARRLLMRGVVLLLPAFTLMGLTLWFFSHPIIRVFLGPKFEASESVLRVLALLLPTAAFTLLLGVQWMIPLGFERAFTKITVFASITNLTAATICARRFAFLGVSWVVVGSEVLTVAMCFWFLSRRGLSPFSFTSRVIRL